MQSKNIAWVIAIIMTVVAVFSFVYQPAPNDSENMTQTAGLSSDASDVQAKLDDLSASHSSLTAENTAFSMLNDNLKDENAALRERIDLLVDAIIEFGSVTDATSETAADTITQLLADTDADSVEELNRAVSRLRQALSDVEQTVTTAIDDAAERSSSTDATGSVSAGQLVELMSAENLELKEKLIALESARESADAYATELQSGVRNLLEENTSLKSEVDYLSTRLRYASNHLRRLRRDVAETEQIAIQQEEQTTELVSEIEAKRSEIKQIISDFTVVSLKSDVLFDSGSVVLTDEGKVALNNVLLQFQNYPNRIISVEGHTDNKKISSRLAQFFPSNWELSASRAATAAKYIVSQGIPEERVRVVGYGPLRPIASNESEQGRTANRRIEIRLVPELNAQESG